MATDKLRFHGKPVAAVDALTPAIAADAAELVRGGYEALPVVADAVEVLKVEVILHESGKTNRTWALYANGARSIKPSRMLEVVIEIDRKKSHRVSSTP